MKITIQEDASLTEPELLIRCAAVDERIERILKAAQQQAPALAGLADGFLRTVRPNDVLYVEAVDGRTFLYTAGQVLEAMGPLSELEALLSGTEFVRASRQMLVNLHHVQGLRPYLNARLELVLSNGEHVIASRQFAPIIKQRIGL